jgi:hypothetical protein
VSDTPSKPPSASNVTTIYVTPKWQDLADQAMEKSGAASWSELFRMGVAKILDIEYVRQ